MVEPLRTGWEKWEFNATMRWNWILVDGGARGNRVSRAKLQENFGYK